MQFSIIIPTYNRPYRLTTCLESLNDQELDHKKWEVIVVDDGSSMNIEEIIKELRLNYSWTYFYQENAGPATARNTGANRAEGTYLAFLDDDCQPDKNWLNILHKTMVPEKLYGGKTINKLNENVYSETSQLLVKYLYKVLLGTPLMFFTTNNFVIDRESFLKCGAFNTKFYLAASEDREFSIRFKHFGYELAYVPDALVFHSHRLTFKSFLAQHFNYGRGNLTFRKIMKQLKINSYLRDKWFFSRLIFYPFNKDYGYKEKLIISFLLGVSQVTYFAGYVFEIFTRTMQQKH